MLWLYTQSGWAFWPATLTANGCVVRPSAHRPFGFGRILGTVAALTVSIIALGELWIHGHSVEVAGAVWAALLIGVADKTSTTLARQLRSLVRFPGRPQRRGRR
ncbi:hypothetical protein [Streptomyces sp. NBC_01373]|uniref:hypothetical protein n=1 Tax=Streptomyces sp. NBC_01373 TaxID=2903843 RepID=UPI00224CFB95|nr:hypothetical protein [Streptomyces sp. NBC_01373]MCX4707150.1 hypothetical protein [Streptomyces sp. NBC_01373]